MNNLEHAKILIEKAKRQADDWETEEAAVTFSIRLCLVWWKKSKIAQRPGRIGGG